MPLGMTPNEIDDLAEAKSQYDRGILSARNPGDRRDILPSSAIGAKIFQEILDVIGPIKDGEGMTVTLTRNPLLVYPSFLFQNPIAQIEFGQGGERTVVEVDIVNGLCIFIPASSVRVRAFNDFPFGYSEPPPQGPVGIGAFINYLPPARRSKIYRSFQILNLAPAAVIDIPIPSYAATAVFERVPMSAFTMQVMDIFGTVMYADVVPISTRQVPLELVGEAGAVRITSDAPLADVTGKVIFEIGL